MTEQFGMGIAGTGVAGAYSPDTYLNQFAGAELWGTAAPTPSASQPAAAGLSLVAVAPAAGTPPAPAVVDPVLQAKLA